MKIVIKLPELTVNYWEEKDKVIAEMLAHLVGEKLAEEAYRDEFLKMVDRAKEEIVHPSFSYTVEKKNE
jgi:hypothetical protein